MILKNLQMTLLILVLSCNLGNSQQEKPVKVPRIVYEVYPNEWYKTQAELWKKEIDRNPKNANAWHNYYNANRYAHFEELDSRDKQAKLKTIIDDMEKAIPESYEYYYLKFKNGGDLSNISLIEKAHEIRPEEPEPLYDLLSFAMINGNEDMLEEFFTKLYESKDIAPWLLNYNYNVLMSVEKDAIIFTNGDNDTYPAEMLQIVNGIRQDVTIINISLSSVQSYLKYKLGKKSIDFDFATLKSRYFGTDADKQSWKYSSDKLIQDICEIAAKKNPDIPIYFTLTVYKNHLTPILDDLYIVGLVYLYSQNRIDNFAIIKKNLEKNFRLDYLKYDWYAEHVPGERLAAQMNLNYFPTMVMLAEHYKTSGEAEQARVWRDFAYDVAKKAGNQEAMTELEKKACR